MSPSSVSRRVAQTVLGLFVMFGALVPGVWAQADVQGQWSAVTNWPILPIHVTLMPTGKVLAWGHDATNNTTLGTIWDPSSNSFQTTSFSNCRSLLLRARSSGRREGVRRWRTQHGGLHGPHERDCI